MNEGKASSEPTTVDVHWHHVPRALVQGIADGSCPYTGTYSAGTEFATLKPQAGNGLELTTSLVDVDDTVAALDTARIDVALASLPPPLMQYDSRLEDAVRYCRAANDAYAESRSESAFRLQPLAHLPMQDPRAAAAEVRRVSDDLGFTGVAIGSNVNGRSLGEADFSPFWEEVAERAMFVFVHGTQSPGWLSELTPASVLSAFAGVAFDCAMSIGSLMFTGVFERFSSLRVCFSHGGGSFPHLLGRWEYGWHHRARSREHLHSPPSEHLEPIFCDSLTHSADALRFLVETIGEDHVLMGSDHPFDMSDPDPVSSVAHAVSSPRAQDLICGGTACQLAGLART